MATTTKLRSPSLGIEFRIDKSERVIGGRRAVVTVAAGNLLHEAAAKSASIAANV